MSAEMAVELARKTLEMAFLLSAPILLVATVMGLLISLLQVMTSVQDMTLSTVPRLFAVGLTRFFCCPGPCENWWCSLWNSERFAPLFGMTGCRPSRSVRCTTGGHIACAGSPAEAADAKRGSGRGGRTGSV